MLLESILFFPLLGAFSLLFIPENNIFLLRQTALISSLITFILSIILWLQFDPLSLNFQFVNKLSWFSSLNINIFIGIDGISLLFVILTTLIFPLCILTSWKNIKLNLKEYLILFLVMETMLIAVFILLDLLLFYITFESVLIPMFLIIGVWGSRRRKVRASYLFFLYTFFGSIFMLFALLTMYLKLGSLDYQILLNSNFSVEYQKWLWLAFFISFAAKIPMVPVHIWLPEAHVEAPTTGSVILAGLLLKLGSYGFIRFLIPLFTFANVYYTPFVYLIALISIVYTSLTAICQTDLKRIIAYSSVAHMNLIMLGLFSLNLQGIGGSVLQMICHGVVSSALFLGIGVIYDRFHTRLLKHYGGLVHFMPLFITTFLFFSFANAALPGTCNFVGEILLFAGIFQKNPIITLFACSGIILSGAYSLWLFNRIAYGNVKLQYLSNISDFNERELHVFLPLIFFTLLLGIFPNFILEKITMVNILGF